MLFRRGVSILLAMVAIVISSGCGNDDTPTSSQSLDETFQPRESLAVAVQDMLSSLQANDYATSFAILDPDARTEYSDVDDWRERQNELPPITGFRLEDADEGQAAVVQHAPGLSPFTGLSVAEEQITWKGTKFDDGWLLEADPSSEPRYPDEAQATIAAREWLEAVRSCDRDRATSMQGVSTLFAGTNTTICGVTGEFVVGAPERLSDGVIANQLTSQYSADALSWARAVPVSGPIRVQVILAPIGNVWKVIGVN